MSRFLVRRITLFTAAALSSALLLSSCGPEQSTRSKTNAQNDAYAEDEASKYAPLMGRYSGTYTYADGTTDTVLLNLVPAVQVVANGGANQSQPVPNMGGSLFLCGKKSGCSTGDQSSVVTIASFTSANYTPNNSTLQMFTTSGPNTQGLQLSAVVNGDHIKGRIFNSLQLGSGTIDLTRVND